MTTGGQSTCGNWFGNWFGKTVVHLEAMASILTVFVRPELLSRWDGRHGDPTLRCYWPIAGDFGCELTRIVPASLPVAALFTIMFMTSINFKTPAFTCFPVAEDKGEAGGAQARFPVSEIVAVQWAVITWSARHAYWCVALNDLWRLRRVKTAHMSCPERAYLRHYGSESTSDGTRWLATYPCL